ncbi:MULTISPECIES: hypothetical protein [unclassified Pseudonocardia]|uniref:hypothetical protein n=1 Tax=unclassified Pseudonocardia TaxID=2619320 RepID=UPI00096042EA|nr:MULTISPECIES: hypothetical protein [unclassified Pseudonocardia]MBN9103117.1 hypothetical protein [Pseudonocardia sp.]OJY41590.1 MAG: hypothetical protein BGP03_20550 [Pseudonocardia sp. 73-21]
MFRALITAAAAPLLAVLVVAAPPAGVAAASEPSAVPVPIGPAVYPGTPMSGWIIERNAVVRSSSWPQGTVVARAQPWHVLDVHCRRTTLEPTARVARTWFLVTLHHREARHDYQGWVAAAAVFTGPFVPRCGPGL